MPETIHERNDVPLVGTYDVIVVGGGVAGVGAALAARRAGCRTLLIEKSVMLGGLATLGLVAYYLPLCDGNGRKVIGGIAEELLRLAIKYGYGTLPAEWRDGKDHHPSKIRYRTAFSPAAFVMALDEAMQTAGVELLFDTVFARPVMDGPVCRAVVVENKSGRTAYAARAFVDATGDADLMARAGAACVEGENGLSYWAYTTDLEMMKAAAGAGDIYRGIKLTTWGGDDSGRGAPAGAPHYRGVSAAAVSDYVLRSRGLAFADLRAAPASRTFLALPGMAQFRMTRRIRGVREVTPADVFKRREDSIGCTCDWRTAGPVFELPYGALLDPGLENVLTAGRTIAAADDAWQVTRVIPPAAMTGQAAGLAAALAAQGDGNAHRVALDALQSRLAEAGVMIHWER